MIKCLVFSDSHGSPENMVRALRMHKDAEYVFFLGDGIRDAEGAMLYENNFIWYSVRGNCDMTGFINGECVKKNEELILFDKKIVLTHGDLFGAKSSLYGLMELADNRGADIVLYGHTHRAGEDYVSVSGRGVYFLNPGSLSDSSFGGASFGILSIDEKSVLFSIKTL